MSWSKNKHVDLYQPISLLQLGSWVMLLYGHNMDAGQAESKIDQTTNMNIRQKESV
jgi:hypothetical protein